MTFNYKQSRAEFDITDVDNSLITNKQQNNRPCNSDDLTTLYSTIQCRLEQSGQFIYITNSHMNFVYIDCLPCIDTVCINSSLCVDH